MPRDELVSEPCWFGEAVLRAAAEGQAGGIFQRDLVADADVDGLDTFARAEDAADAFAVVYEWA